MLRAVQDLDGAVAVSACCAPIDDKSTTCGSVAARRWRRANRGPAIVASAASEPIWMCRIRRGSGSAIALSAAEIPRFLTSVSSELEVIARFGDKTVKIRGA
jgi:hypothetical protein